MISMRMSQAAEALKGKYTGNDVIFNGCSTDTRTIEEGNLFIALNGNHFDGHSFIRSARENGASAAMVEIASDNNNLPLLLIKDTTHAMGLLASYWRDEFDIPVFAITGSNGKTTVKEMVASILGLNATVLSTQGNMNNHIGVPLTLFKLDNKHEYAVIEMGANHPGEIGLLSKLAKPSIALITQCAPAHLEGFGSVDGVARAKAEIFSGLSENGVAVVNADDDFANFWKKIASNYKQISFGLESEADITASDITFDTATGHTKFNIHFPEKSISTSIRFSGIHNVLNSIAAAACCIAAGISIDDIKKGLECISPVKGRMQLITTSNGIRIFNDTYNANPASLKAGLQVLSNYSGNRWLILGDMGELGNDSAEHHRLAGELAREYGVQRLFTLGEFSKYIVEGFGSGSLLFLSSDDLISTVLRDLVNDTTILVKGSRAMGMEKIVDSLMEDY
ncbi:MAG: UDP-N-acetylmuramoyl-tripeptide--D-alanyl-D-alanine ligase [Gammaproteobacteria bacterium]|jgi:UDP-N-acetylmuramoyl-tripeptide--D-alanyl-D-alanine ligase